MKSIKIGDIELPNAPFVWSYWERMSLTVDTIKILNNQETINLYKRIIKDSVPNIYINNNITGYVVKQNNFLGNNTLNISLHTLLFEHVTKEVIIDNNFIGDYKVDVLCHDLSNNIKWIDCKDGQWSNQHIWIHNSSLSPFESLRFNIIDTNKESKFIIYICDALYDLNVLCLFTIDATN